MVLGPLKCKSSTSSTYRVSTPVLSVSLFPVSLVPVSLAGRLAPSPNAIVQLIYFMSKNSFQALSRRVMLFIQKSLIKVSLSITNVREEVKHRKKKNYPDHRTIRCFSPFSSLAVTVYMLRRPWNYKTHHSVGFLLLPPAFCPSGLTHLSMRSRKKPKVSRSAQLAIRSRPLIMDHVGTSSCSHVEAAHSGQ